MPSTTADLPANCIHTAESVEEFLEYLQLRNGHWAGAQWGDLAYRGQSSSIWRLVPKALRGEDVTRVEPQAKAEFDNVHRFVQAADMSGLRVTEGGGRLLLGEIPALVFREPDWEYQWPSSEILEALALAQHHTVSTRLLDFSENPLIAAFFAVNSAWENREPPQLDEHVAVWVLDLRFIRAINRIRFRYPERIEEVRVPRANNEYLKAQAGFFLVDRGLNDTIGRGEIPAMDQVLLERADYWHRGIRLARKGITRTWFDVQPIRLVRLHASLTQDLLIELDKRGVNLGTAMPSLDKVVDELDRKKNIEAGK